MLKVSRLFGLFALAGLLVAGAALNLESRAQAQGGKKKWDIVRAHNDLRIVHRDLKTLKSGAYGGHRAKAIKHVESANRHLTAAAKHYFKGKLPESWTRTLPKAPKKTSLQKLHDDLSKAHKDMRAVKAGSYGGHRAKASAELEKAIAEVKKAIAHAKKGT